MRKYFFWKFQKQPSVEVLRIFNAGHVLESWWIEFLDKKKDVEVLCVNMPCRHINPFYRIHGRIDVLIQKGYGELEVHEMKTIKSFGRWLEEPKIEHVNQIQFYLNVLGIESGSIDYVNKLGFLHGKDVIDKRFPIQRDKSVFKLLIGRAHNLFGAFMADIPPPVEKCWKCDGYCIYNDECGGEIL